MKKLLALTLSSIIASVALTQTIVTAEKHNHGLKITPVLSLQTIEGFDDVQPILTAKANEAGKLLDCIVGDERLTARQLSLSDSSNVFGYKAALVFGPRKEAGKPSDHGFENWPSLFFRSDVRFNSKGDTGFTWNRSGKNIDVLCFHSRED